MARRLSKLELRIMDVLWAKGPSSVREVQEAFAESDRPAYTTVQTTIYRLETKRAVRRVKKVSNAHIFEAVTDAGVGAPAAHRRPAWPLRRPRPAGDDTSHRNRPPHPRRPA